MGKLLKNLFLFFGYLLLAVFALFPLIWGMKLSLTPKYDYSLIPSSLTLKNYQDILGKMEILVYFLNSLKVSVGCIFLALPLALLAAYALARFAFRGKTLLAMALLILPMLPSTAILVPLVSYFNAIGLYNTLWGVIIVNMVFNLPLAIWMLRNFIINTPKSIEEAALIDGLNSYQTLARVTLPMIHPGVVSVVIYMFITCWNGYTYSYALTTSQSHRVLAQGLLAFLGSWGTNWGGLTAMGILMVLPPVLIFLFFQDIFIAGMFGESLK